MNDHEPHVNTLLGAFGLRAFDGANCVAREEGRL